jgi:hypothetical protein
MSEQSPSPGDLLISQRAGDGHFEISIVPGRPQLSIPHQHDAVTQAHAFAAQNGAAVWMIDASGSIVRVPPPKRKES